MALPATTVARPMLYTNVRILRAQCLVPQLGFPPENGAVGSRDIINITKFCLNMPYDIQNS